MEDILLRIMPNITYEPMNHWMEGIFHSAGNQPVAMASLGVKIFAAVLLTLQFDYWKRQKTKSN